MSERDRDARERACAAAASLRKGAELSRAADEEQGQSLMATLATVRMQGTA
jgi:hypothetical protein